MSGFSDNLTFDSVILKIRYDPTEATKEGIIHVVSECSGAIREVEEVEGYIIKPDPKEIERLVEEYRKADMTFLGVPVPDWLRRKFEK